jgi:hypothetical protein
MCTWSHLHTENPINVSYKKQYKHLWNYTDHHFYHGAAIKRNIRTPTFTTEWYQLSHTRSHRLPTYPRCMLCPRSYTFSDLNWCQFWLGHYHVVTSIISLYKRECFGMEVHRWSIHVMDHKSEEWHWLEQQQQNRVIICSPALRDGCYLTFYQSYVAWAADSIIK